VTTDNDPTRYTMRVEHVAERLQCTKQTVRNLANTGQLSFITQSRGMQDWYVFDPAEVEALALKRNGEEVKP
jgi:hypothetical protein